MLPAAYLRAVRQFDPADTIVIEFHSGDRVIVWDQEYLVVGEEWCSYIEEGGISHFFEPSTVAQVMGYATLPDLDAPPYPHRNGRV